MDDLEAWFPYPAFRPHQREMLELAGTVAAEGGIAMIDAPTGSGKSSVVAAMLAARLGRKVIVAVRTVSQLDTFVRELQLIRVKQPSLRFAYLIGKGSMCPLPGQGDVYRRCEGVKAFSTALMKERAQKGSLVPARDPQIRLQLKKQDPDHPLLCPYFITSRHFVQAEDSGSLRMVLSASLRTRADRLAADAVAPRELPGLCGDCCPYEAMLQAARTADVVILNYHHLFDDEIREQLYQSLGIESPKDVLLLIDEAHNCGDVVQEIQSVECDAGTIELAGHELAGLRRYQSSAGAILELLPRVDRFIDGLSASPESMDWFDPAIFARMVLRGSLYQDTGQIVDDLAEIRDFVREKSIEAGDFKETAIERLSEFFYRVDRAARDPAFLSVFRRLDEDRIALAVRNIDPAPRLSEVAGLHGCAVMISGTLSPVQSYRRYYFEDLPVRTLSLPNAFPRENRLVLVTKEITTAFSQRQNRENAALIEEYIIAFASAPGNVAVYFPSYQLLDQFGARCARRIRAKQVFVEPKESADASAALREFLSLPGKKKAGVLFAVTGGKWSEGLDYRGEMLSGAMVVGLPLAPFNRVRRMVIDYFVRKFGEEGEFISYTLPAINRALQALGRVLRTPEDRGLLVLAEQRFLEDRVRGGLPPWMQEECEPVTIQTFREAITRWR
jgi:DNA excision repair protein ERCC-2